jgi:hypothetical protein
MSFLTVINNTQMLPRKAYIISSLLPHRLASVVSVNLTPSLNETGLMFRV